jgi:hypothetical protein
MRAAEVLSGLIVVACSVAACRGPAGPPLRAPVALAAEWELVGEAVNEPGWDVWGASPIFDDGGRVHLFVARWPSDLPFDPSWRVHSQIARYVADRPQGPFRFVEVVLQGDGEGWNAQGLHNPNIQRVGERFALTFIANDGRGRHGPNQRIGMVVADRLEGPWAPVHGDPDLPLLAPPQDADIWCHDSGCGVNNPALLAHPDGRFLLYFKAKRGPEGPVRMGLAVADRLEGPYAVQPEPVTDNERGIEDGYAFLWCGRVCLITTDNHGILERGGGLLWWSADGLDFAERPLPAFHHLGDFHLPDGVPATARVRYTPEVKLERPGLLVIDGEPAWLYAPCGVALDGSDGTNCYVLRRRAAAP